MRRATVAFLAACALLTAGSSWATGHTITKSAVKIWRALRAPGGNRVAVKNSTTALRMMTIAAKKGLFGQDTAKLDAALQRLVKSGKPEVMPTEVLEGQKLVYSAGTIKLTRHYDYGNPPGQRVHAGTLKIKLKKPGQQRASDFVSVIFADADNGGIAIANINFH